MHEPIKETSFAIFFVCGAVAAFAWYFEPGPTNNIVRLASTSVSILTLLVFLRLHFKADQVPDFLTQKCRTSFDAHGMRVAFVPTVRDGLFVLDIYFQGKFTEEAVIRVGLRPKQGLLGRPKGLDLKLEPIDCPPAGFGVMHWPIPVPLKSQGKTVTFEVGLSVEYPNGHGTQVRFRSGLRVKHEANFYRTDSKNLFTLTLVSYLPAQCKLQLPTNVAEGLPMGVGEQDEIFWKLGDPEIDPAASA